MYCLTLFSFLSSRIKRLFFVIMQFLFSLSPQVSHRSQVVRIALGDMHTTDESQKRIKAMKPLFTFHFIRGIFRNRFSNRENLQYHTDVLSPVLSEYCKYPTALD